ncbi:hypothetical protein Clacol_004416 [Clathrus columnatus]|uniref:Uncharacterized protein n=1 Tax=Clathrus columnatus TaxID=1419009 RepID=A0AAV5ABA1_9AGAM|nr:hypothetical protein Clacol_004416 [Clathrus columnatus]
MASSYSRSIQQNPLKTREHLKSFLEEILNPLERHTSPGGALIRLGNTATHYDERAAQLETFSRPLWALGSLLAGGGYFKGTERWVKGFASGTNPDHEEFWGNMRNKDQRMVECAAIGFTLSVAKEHVWDPLDEGAKRNFEKWLGGMNDKVFANLGLSKVNSPHFSPTRMKADLDHLDTFYLGQGKVHKNIRRRIYTNKEGTGWSRDGPEGVRQLDYYSSSFAIQYAQLVYSKLAEKEDPERCKEYRQRANLFAAHFIHFFDPDGPAIPFGRSSTYRFAQASFWGALAFADVLPDGVFTWGVIKGLLLRNFRYWAKQPFLDTDGIVTLGYVYPNHNMLENYNSPGSPYWCCKSFIPLSLPESHPFWTSVEEPYPKVLLETTIGLDHPLQFVTNMGEHSFLLSSGQKCHYPLRHAAQKYGKLAYSASFGFSVPVGNESLEEIGGDSTLALSDDGGETWKVRRDTLDAKFVGNQWLQSSWKPWPDVQVDTWLIPPTNPDFKAWHIRAHRIKTGRNLISAEGGWAVYGQREDGRALEDFPADPQTNPTVQGKLEKERMALTKSSAGVSGIIDLVVPDDVRVVAPPRKGRAVRLDANSNIIFSRAVLPTLMGEHPAGEEVSKLYTAVFGIPVRDGQKDVRAGWEKEWEKVPPVPKGVLF